MPSPGSDREGPVLTRAHQTGRTGSLPQRARSRCLWGCSEFVMASELPNAELVAARRRIAQLETRVRLLRLADPPTIGASARHAWLTDPGPPGPCRHHRAPDQAGQGLLRGGAGRVLASRGRLVDRQHTDRNGAHPPRKESDLVPWMGSIVPTVGSVAVKVRTLSNQEHLSESYRIPIRAAQRVRVCDSSPARTSAGVGHDLAWRDLRRADSPLQETRAPRWRPAVAETTTSMTCPDWSIVR
jgi:hypothetical protein